MSEIIVEKNKSTNIKPDRWYKGYLKIENDYLLKHPKIQSKSYPLMTIKEIKEYDVMADKNQSHDNVSGFLQFKENNNLSTNKILLVRYKKDLESLKLWKSIKDIEEIDNGSEKYSILQTSFKINKCLEALEMRYLITAQLEDIMDITENFLYNEVDTNPILDILKQFKFGNYQEELFDFIKQNTNWHNKIRDFEIYKEIQNNKLYSEIAEALELTIPAVSMINKKVQSSINNLKGKFFEIKYEKYLKSVNKFRNSKVVRDGNPGKPDIYIIDNIKKELYIFSLKNLELNKKSFCIVKEQLKPELEFAYYKNTFEDYEKVILYLIVFDSLTEKLFVKEIDYKNPSNINI